MGLNKPIEAWVNEMSEMLYIGFPEGKPPFAGIQATARAGEALREWGYSIAPSYVEIREYRDAIYVYPDEYNNDDWDAAKVSEDKVEGWIEVWEISAKDLQRCEDCE